MCTLNQALSQVLRAGMCGCVGVCVGRGGLKEKKKDKNTALIFRKVSAFSTLSSILQFQKVSGLLK